MTNDEERDIEAVLYKVKQDMETCQKMSEFERQQQARLMKEFIMDQALDLYGLN